MKRLLPGTPGYWKVREIIFAHPDTGIKGVQFWIEDEDGVPIPMTGRLPEEIEDARANARAMAAGRDAIAELAGFLTFAADAIEALEDRPDLTLCLRSMKEEAEVMIAYCDLRSDKRNTYEMPQ